METIKTYNFANRVLVIEENTSEKIQKIYKNNKLLKTKHYIYVVRKNKMELYVIRIETDKYRYEKNIYTNTIIKHDKMLNLIYLNGKLNYGLLSFKGNNIFYENGIPTKINDCNCLIKNDLDQRFTPFQNFYSILNTQYYIKFKLKKPYVFKIQNEVIVEYKCASRYEVNCYISITNYRRIINLLFY